MSFVNPSLYIWFVVLAYFSSDADLITQLSCGCHTCAQNKTVLKGEFCFGVIVNSTAPTCSRSPPALLNLRKGTKLRSCRGTLLTQYIPEQLVVWLLESVAK